jgi:peptidoglycan/LPS O-acetylase OafA/YrhL
MLHHLEKYGPLRESAAQALPEWVVTTMVYGWTGVLLFFVISGFVAACSFRSQQITWRYAGLHFVRRLVRLGVPYFTLLALVLAMDLVLRVLLGVPTPTDDAPTLGRIVAHLFFLQDILGYDNLSTGLWFVCIEVQLCLVLLALLALAQRLSRGRSPGARSGILLAVFLPLALVSLATFGRYPEYECYAFYFFSILLLGIIGFWALQGTMPRWVFWTLLAAFGLRLVLEPSLDLAIAAGCGLMIYLVGRAGGLATWLSHPVLQYLGRISYSLFLIHYPVIHVVLLVGYRLTGDRAVAAVLWEVVAIAASFVAAHLFYTLVEAPSNRLAARLKSGVRVASVPV